LAATVSIVAQGSGGDLRYSIADITCDNAYTNGTGYVFTPSQFGLTTFFAVGVPESSGGFDFNFAASTGALKAFDTGASSGAVLSEATTNNANLNGVVTRMFVMGK
jgi:hypothetical protein